VDSGTSERVQLPPPHTMSDLGDLSKLTVKVLQKELKDRRLETKGRKAELVERLTKALARGAAAAAGKKRQRQCSDGGGGSSSSGGGEGRGGGGEGGGGSSSMIATALSLAKRVKKEHGETKEKLEDAQETLQYVVQAENNKMSEIDELKSQLAAQAEELETLRQQIRHE
jgi:hypothetical protein